MKKISGAILISLLLLGTIIPAAGATECNKSYLIQIELTSTGATEKLTQVVWGSTPLINESAGAFRGEILAKDGSTISSFWIWDPRVQLGDNVVMDRNGTAKLSSGTKGTYEKGDLILQLPYSEEAAAFRLSLTAKKPLLVIDLTKAQDARTFNCTKEMYISPKPRSSPAGTPADTTIFLLAGLLVLICAAGAGWYFLRKKGGP